MVKILENEDDKKNENIEENEVKIESSEKVISEKPYVRPSKSPVFWNKNLMWKWMQNQNNFWSTQIRRSTSRGR